jgi:hypothetical protein
MTTQPTAPDRMHASVFATDPPVAYLFLVRHVFHDLHSLDAYPGLIAFGVAFVLEFFVMYYADHEKIAEDH